MVEKPDVYLKNKEQVKAESQTAHETEITEEMWLFSYIQPPGGSKNTYQSIKVRRLQE